MMLDTALNNEQPMFAASEGATTIDLSMISSTAVPQTKEVDCLIILNSDICFDLLNFFVKAAHQIILCDGGANFFYGTQYKDAPNIKGIVGDMDSIHQEVRAYYSTRVDIRDLHDDQDTNDLEKALNYAVQLQVRKIVCLGALGGRFDQEMCNVSVIQKYSEKYANIEFMALGRSSLLYAVKPDIKTFIKVGNFFIKNQVGLVAFCRAKVQTLGFKWNLGKEYGLEYLQWGILVSSSNQIVNNEVSITTSHPIFFTIQFPFK